MRLRIRTVLCCTAIFSAVSFFTITFAETNPLSKAQVADRIRKVENGVDDFEKYLTTRGENAKNQAGSAKSSGAAKRSGATKRGQGANSANKEAGKEKASQGKDDLQNAMDDLNRTTNRLRASSMRRRIIWRQKCKWSRSWTARAALIRWWGKGVMTARHNASGLLCARVSTTWRAATT